MQICAAWLAFVFALAAAEIQPTSRPTFHSSIAAASEAAASDRSLVLIVLGGDWCPACKHMRETTFQSNDFRERAGTLRIAEVDVQATPKTADDFGAEAFPTLVLMSADGKIIARGVGYKGTNELLAWLDIGRQRASQGLWEGTAPGAALNEFMVKASADRLNDEDLKKLVALLGRPEPGERIAAAKLVAAQRENAVPPLIEAVADPYLGQRVGASELLRKLAPDAPRFDPWQSPGDIPASLEALKKWWAQAGKLPATAEPVVVDPALKSSLVASMEALRGADAAKRTEAMSALVSHGSAALPSIREAIRRSDKAGDHRSVSLLEDVRWAILIPDSIEQRANARGALARGTSPERQAAATRLGHAGADAIPALTELVHDSDALVVGSSVRALSGIGGKDAIPAMAALLKAADSNLRMTAAQALGHTKEAEATKPLLTVIDDPNEIVACTALAAIEEVNSRENSPSSRREQSPEIVAALKQALGDPRWRVRATAAEIAGKLQLSQLVPELKARVADADGFVVKSALGALQSFGSVPEPAQLAEAARRLPALRADVVRLLSRSPSDDAVRIASEMFEQGNEAERASILTALGERERFDTTGLDDSWEPLLSRGATNSEVVVRRAAAALLGRLSPRLAVKMVGPLLGDADKNVRSFAAESALELLSGKKSKRGGDEEEFSLPDDVVVAGAAQPKGKTNQTVVTASVRAAWHEALLKSGDGDHEPLAATALFATGSGTNTAPFAAVLEKIESTAIKRFVASPALDLVVPQLRWPEGEPVLKALARSPLLFIAAAVQSRSATNQVRDALLEPTLFKAVLERTPGDALEAALPLLLRRSSASWSLFDPSPQTRAIVSGLLDATNAAWRTAAIFVTGRRKEAGDLPAIEKALGDSNQWVRVAAIQSLARQQTERAALEQRLGTFVGDRTEEVAEMAAAALIEQEVRAAANISWALDMFRFNAIQVPGSSSFGSSDERPLTLLETKPPYLAAARQWLVREPKDATAFALLLAQHGEPEGIETLVRSTSKPRAKGDSFASSAALAAIALSKDAKYMPVLRNMMDTAKEDYELRMILRALKGMSGADARALRLEVNKRIRLAGNQ